MATKSSIEWTEVTWNPVTGCSKVSAGCKNCYAIQMAARIEAMGRSKKKPNYNLLKRYDGTTKKGKNGIANWTGKVICHEDLLEIPKKWKKKRVVFVNSMSDLFHENVPLSFIKKVFKVMNETTHIYQVLTKRSERLKAIAHELTWTNNIWMGVSVEEEKVSFRIKDLTATPAAIKFLSIEPLIGAVQNLYLEKIDWVIVGGESGHKARPVKSEWIEFIHKTCLETNTPFFFKQWGKTKFNPVQTDPTINTNHKQHAKGGCQLNGTVYRNMPQSAVA